MEAEVSAANRELDEFKVENEGLRREAESREALLKEKSIEAENLRLELTAVKNDAEMKKEIARVSQEGSERALAATRDQAETAERAARELAGNFAVERLEHARLQTELRQEFNKSLVSRLKTDLATGRAGIGEQSTFWFTKVNDLLITYGRLGAGMDPSV
jgi:hypothetical protein